MMSSNHWKSSPHHMGTPGFGAWISASASHPPAFPWWPWCLVLLQVCLDWHLGDGAREMPSDSNPNELHVTETMDHSLRRRLENRLWRIGCVKEWYYDIGLVASI